MSETTLALETELLSVAREAAAAAGAELMARWRKPIAVRTKSTPTDPVSDADVAAEQAIRAVLAARRPGDAILGEEGGQTEGDGSGGVSGSGGLALRWVIDPLDGTVNYLYGLPAFAVSIVVEDDAGGLAAAVLEPATGELFVATRSGPALFFGPEDDGAGVPLHGSRCNELEQALIGTGFSYSPRRRALQARVASEVLPRARDIRRIGAAALDMCWVAAGRLDGYWERGVKPWDIGAGTLICQRAGMVVRPLAELRDDEGEVLLRDGVVTAPASFFDEFERLVVRAPSLD